MPISTNVAFLVKFSAPIALNTMLAKLDRVLDQNGFLHPHSNPNARYSEAILFGTDKPVQYIKWPDYDRPFEVGQFIDFFYLSREQFGDSYDEGPFPIIFRIRTANTDRGGAIAFSGSSNLSSGHTDRPWWPAAFGLLKPTVLAIHSAFECEDTRIYFEPQEEDPRSPGETILQLRKGDSGLSITLP